MPRLSHRIGGGILCLFLGALGFASSSGSRFRWASFRSQPTPCTAWACLTPPALVVGGLAGPVGGWAFGKWMAQVGFFPLIAGLVGSQSRTVGVTLHFAFAITIDASLGVLFQRDLRGYKSSTWPTASCGGSSACRPTPRNPRRNRKDSCRSLSTYRYRAL